MNNVIEHERIDAESFDAYLSLPDFDVADHDSHDGAHDEKAFDDIPFAGRFPEVRQQLHEAYRSVSDEEIERWVIENFEGMTADDLENFMKSLKQFGKAAGATLSQAAPGMLQGAVSGATVGMAAGPYGALIGAGLGAIGGGAVSIAQQQNRPAAPATQATPPTPPAPAQPAAPPRPVATSPIPARPLLGGVLSAGFAPMSPPPLHAPTVAPLPGQAAPQPPHGQPSPAAGQAPAAIITQLLALLSQPQVIQAVTSLAMQRAGRDTVQYGDIDVPTLHVLGELARLSNEALATTALTFDGTPH